MLHVNKMRFLRSILSGIIMQSFDPTVMLEDVPQDIVFKFLKVWSGLLMIRMSR